MRPLSSPCQREPSEGDDGYGSTMTRWYATILDMFPHESCRVRGGGRAWQVFFFTFSPVAALPPRFFYAAHHSTADLRLDKWRWQERIICSNITSASCASTTALLSLKSGANTLCQAHESHSAWLKVCSLILMKNRANVAPLLFFSVSKLFFFFAGTVWSIHFHPQSPIVFMQRVTRLFRLSCTSRISTLALLLRRWKAIGVTGKSVCFYVISSRIFTNNFRWQPQNTVRSVAAGAAHTL